MQKIKLILILLILFTFNGLFAQWIQTNGPIGGDEMPEFNYCNNKLYAGTVSGLYSSIDNGINWTKEDFDFPQQEVSFISVKDSNIIAGFANGYSYFYNYDNGSWEKLKIKLLEGETIKFTKVSNEVLSVITNKDRIILSFDYGKHFYYFTYDKKNSSISLIDSISNIDFLNKKYFCLSDENHGTIDKNIFVMDSSGLSEITVIEKQCIHENEKKKGKNQCNCPTIKEGNVEIISESDSLILFSTNFGFYFLNKNSQKTFSINHPESKLNQYVNCIMVKNKIISATEKGLFYYKPENKKWVSINADTTVFLQIIQ